MLDLAVEARRPDPRAPLRWITAEWAKHFEARALARHTLGESEAEEWPDIRRATRPSGKDERLGIPGPKTQYDAVVQDGQEGGGFIMREIEPGARYCFEDVPATPWIFECSCGLRRTISPDKLSSLVRAVLAAGRHRLTLP